MIFSFLLTLMMFMYGTPDHLPELSEVRTMFYESVENEAKTKMLFKELNKHKINLPAVYLGYHGATEALLAKHSWNPYKKVEYLNKGMNTLTSAISKQPENLELRFLRFSIQHYLPSFLGQSKNLIDDRNMMIDQITKKNYKNEDLAMVKNVAGFLLESQRCTTEQQKVLKNYI